jgi:hypothetical protein
MRLPLTPPVGTKSAGSSTIIGTLLGTDTGSVYQFLAGRDVRVPWREMTFAASGANVIVYPRGIARGHMIGAISAKPIKSAWPLNPAAVAHNRFVAAPFDRTAVSNMAASQ